ncbi:nitric oxide-associated protein 1 [Myripristis murdjan]|uniref:Nitric oxide associated 1 n=1 Tax=Myripristis murdjan TaxID=586833 RepID=A0A668AV46_9TELE|nr:nitric oxide-associated protein 1 [Myripristis murdjan]
MFKLLRLGLHEAAALQGRRPACCVSALRDRPPGSRGPRDSRGSGPVLTQQLCLPARTACRFYSSRRRERRDTAELRYASTVDPDQEEQFVFLEEAEPEPQVPQLEPGPPAAPGPQVSSGRTGAGRQQRALERQLQQLQAEPDPDPEPDCIHFHDTDFPLDQSILTAKRKRTKKVKGQQKIFGSPDVDEPVSDVCCSGCGALLHCAAANVAGYLPSEKYKALLQEGRLGSATCQRCYLLTHHRRALNVTMSREEYRDIVRGIKSQKALVLLIVDLLDVPDSIVPDLLELVGGGKHIVVLGNKVDLLPGDSPNYLQRIKRQLSQYCVDAGLGDRVTDVHLISAKTGYGVERLISSLQSSWKYKGDVYLVGTANAGKSTLFNTLLESDYCKSKASDVFHKATISPWPGTTLNLLKFPIINPTPYRMMRRRERLSEAARQADSELPPAELRRLQQLSRHGYLVGRVGRTFRADSGARRHVIEFDADSLAFGENAAGEPTQPASSSSPDVEFSHNELKDAHWLFDTPGIMKERDILSLLTEEEVKLLVPTRAIVPRTFVLKPGTSLFLGGLGRIDYLQGERSCWFSVVASSQLPVHLTSVEKADAVYQKHAGHTLLGVPLGGAERMQQFPALVCEDVRLQGEGFLQATADIKLCSAGWVAVTAAEGQQLLLRLHGPAAAGFSVRKPPLLPHVVALKGKRIHRSAAYKPVRPAALVDSSLSAPGSSIKKKKKKEEEEKRKERKTT